MSLSVPQFVGNISEYIVNPMLALLFAGGLLVFVFGVVEFMLGLGAEDNDKRESGKRHMFWGIAGMFIMISAGAIVGIISNSVCNGTGVAGCPQIR